MLLASLSLATVPSFAQHEIVNQSVGLRVVLPGNWSNLKTDVLDTLDSHFLVTLNRENGRSFEMHSEACIGEGWGSKDRAARAFRKHETFEAATEVSVPFENATVYRVAYDKGPGITYDGYAAYFREGDTCFQVQVLSAQPFDEEREYFAATLESLRFWQPTYGSAD